LATPRGNRAVQDLYEPGSTFKVVTASAAIEEGDADLP
jgi:cell division protein FtsI/penicillin-binding protein 2